MNLFAWLNPSPLRVILLFTILAVVYAAAVIDWQLSLAFGESSATTTRALSNVWLFFLVLLPAAFIVYRIFHSPRLTLHFTAASILILFSGLEDILYFHASGRPLPAELPWLSANPLVFLFGEPITAFTVTLSAFVWTLIAAYLLFRR